MKKANTNLSVFNDSYEADVKFWIKQLSTIVALADLFPQKTQVP